ncbi:MAG: HAD family hydrolase [bacterium]|nr:HAD family hydrolase [bacterium]
MIKGIIFDLDMCILDTRSLSGPFFQTVLDPLQHSNLPTTLKEDIIRHLWTTSLDDTIELFAVPEDIAKKMREAYRHIDVPNGIKSFGDEEYLRKLLVKKILVTSGYKNFQQTKIDKLGIANLFDEVIIDELDDRVVRKGKRRIFEEVLKNNQWDVSEVLVIGDNPLSELGAAKSLGIATVQTLRPTIKRWSEADYHIQDFSELQAIINKTP